MSPRTASLPRVVIENVWPQVGGGRHPVKRVVGQRVDVEADIYKDGHDLIGARVLFRGPGARTWRSVDMEYRYDPDRWYATFEVDAIGRWQFTIEAWPDAFGTWQAELEKRLEAGQDVSPELLEASAMLLAVAGRAKGERAGALEELGRRLADAGEPLDRRIEAARAKDLHALVGGPVDEAARTRAPQTLEVLVDREVAGFSAWYEVFPRSLATKPGRHGTFADAAARLADIGDLGFDVVYLPPIHPIGVAYRKGPNNTPGVGVGQPGSPWAIGGPEGGHTAVHPELGTIDDFDAFVAEAAAQGLEVALDYALQCSPDHPWVAEHPDWFHRRPDGTIHYAENPPKKYQDIYPLNFWTEDREAMWEACRDILLFWIEHGVKIFRVDNPHTKPFAFWQWCLADVQARHPDTVFLAEAFTRPNRMKGLAKLGFNQSYTYFTWKNTKWELVDYLTELTTTEMAEYFRPNFFANTPDILHEYLQTGGRAAFRVRLVLAATLSPVYGIYSGFELCENVALREGSEEYLNSEKYEIRVRDWQAAGNIRDDVRLLNQLRRSCPALRTLTNLRFVPVANDWVICYRKSAPGEELLVVVNLDPVRARETTVTVPLAELGLAADEQYAVEDLLTGVRYTWQGADSYVRLDPAERVAHVFELPIRSVPSETAA